MQASNCINVFHMIQPFLMHHITQSEGSHHMILQGLDENGSTRGKVVRCFTLRRLYGYSSTYHVV